MGPRVALLARERSHRLLIDEARRGLADIAVGHSFEADGAIAQLQQRRAALGEGVWPGKTGQTRRQVAWLRATTRPS